MNYHKIETTSIANGIGVRCVLWCAGCSLHCKGCQNPSTWDFNSGKLFDEAAKQALFEVLSKPYIKGITFSGGHPLEEKNRHEIYNLLKEIKSQFPEKDVWMYTGYTWEYISDIQEIQQILQYVDVLVDGPYIEAERDITLAFRGSRNQRLIDVQKSLFQGKIITLQND